MFLNFADVIVMQWSADSHSNGCLRYRDISTPQFVHVSLYMTV